VFIATTLTPILADNNVTAFTGYEAYLLALPANLYAITALLFVFAVAYFRLDFGPMRRWEQRAITEGIVTGPSSGPVPGEMDESLPIRDDGKVADLVAPVLTLIGVTVAGTVWIGITETDGPVTPTAILANTNVILALFFGGLLAVAVAAVRLLIRRTPVGQIAKAGLSGIRSMLMAAVVLFCAWVTAEIMGELGIGEYLAGIIDDALPLAVLPLVLFVLASFIAFSIGSTFGTFGLLLPIAAEIAIALDSNLLIPVFGAVLAGAIFGDHTSPLSDTTILSAIGSGVHLIDHVTTQLPYALVAAAAAAIGFLVSGITENTGLGLLAAIAALLLAVIALKGRSAERDAVPERAPQEGGIKS
jgi:tetracycline resistance efflux pump